jgi:fibronectin-binding autotransporter adhesin
MKTLLMKLQIQFWIGAIALLAVAIAAAPVGAAWTWDGGGADDSLLTGENWNPDAIPIFDTSTNTTLNINSSLIFTGNVRTSPTVPEGSTANYQNVTFDANAAPFTINLAGTTGSFRLGPTGNGAVRTLANNSPNVQTFNAPVLGSVVDIKATSAGFVFNSTYSAGSSSTGSRRTLITGSNNIWFNGGISGAGYNYTDPVTAGAILFQGTGTCYIPVASASTNANSIGGLWNGVFNIYSGALRISHNDALGAGTATVPLPGDTQTDPGRTVIQGSSNTGRLELVGGLTISEKFQLAARTGASNFAPHIVSVSGNNTLTGPVEALSGGTNITIQSDSGLLTLNGDFTMPGATGGRTLYLRGASNGVLNGNVIPLTDTIRWRLYKEDAGTWTINSSGNTSKGDTNIYNGTLALNGAGSLSSSGQFYLVNSTATFDVSGVTGGLWTLAPATAQNLVGSGTVKGNVQDTAFGATISGGTIGTTGTLTFSNNLSLTGGGTLRFDLGPDGSIIGGGLNDLLSIGGNLSLAGTTAVVLNNTDIVQGFASGTYRLIDYTGSLTGNASNFTVSALAGTTRQTFSISTATPKQVNLLVTGAPLSLTWKGDGTTNAWDVATTANWNNNTEKFYPTDSVTFDDTGSNNPAVSLSTSDVSPGSITVNNTAKNYTISGFYAIVGNAGLTKSGTGKLTIDNSAINTFKGAIAVNGGTLEVGSGGSAGNLGTGVITLAAGATLAFNRGDAITIANVISGAGTLEQNGAYGTLDLTGLNDNFAGPVTVSQGTLKLTATNDTGTAAGLSDITNNGIVQLDSAAATWTVNRRIVGTGSVEKTGVNRVSTSFNNTYSGGTTVSAGILRLTGTESSLGTGPVNVVGGATLTFYRVGAYTVSNVISGSGAVTFDRAEGIVTLAGDNSLYDGNASINDGTVILGSATGLGSAAGYTYITSSTAANLALTGGITINEPIVMGTRGSSAAHSYMPHILNLSGNNEITGAITAGTGGSRCTIQSDGGLLTLSNTITNTTSGTDHLVLRGAGNGVAGGSIMNGTGEWRLYNTMPAPGP